MDISINVEELLKKGSYRKWNETYYWQVQVYMLGLKLKRAAAFIYCKDNSKMEMVRMKLDRKATLKKLQTVFEAIDTTVMPDRVCPRRDHFEAKFCPYHAHCFGIRKAANLTQGKSWKRKMN